MTFFFFNDTATTEIYTLSLHDALPISACMKHLRPLAAAAFGSLALVSCAERPTVTAPSDLQPLAAATDRKSTRLNSSHANISYAVFCLKKKKQLLHARHRSRSPTSHQP